MAYVNINREYTFFSTATTNLGVLSSVTCSEVTIVNRGTPDIFVFDKNRSSSEFGFPIKQDEAFTFGGITNTNEVSTYTLSGTSDFYYRTRYFNRTLNI